MSHVQCLVSDKNSLTIAQPLSSRRLFSALLFNRFSHSASFRAENHPGRHDNRNIHGEGKANISAASPVNFNSFSIRPFCVDLTLHEAKCVGDGGCEYNGREWKLNYKQSVITKFGHFSDTSLDACGRVFNDAERLFNGDLRSGFGELMTVIIWKTLPEIQSNFPTETWISFDSANCRLNPNPVTTEAQTKRNEKLSPSHANKTSWHSCTSENFQLRITRFPDVFLPSPNRHKTIRVGVRK